MSLKKYILRRCLQLAIVVIAVIVTNFIIIHLTPGDPVKLMVSDYAPPEFIEAARIRFGLDKPLIDQLGIYMLSIFQGDFGYSFYFGSPVLDVVLERLPATLWLMGTGYVIGAVLGILFGVVSAVRRYSIWDNVTMVTSLIFYSLPTFWLGLILMLIFSIYLGWFPAQGMYSPTAPSGILGFLDFCRHLALPSLVVGAWNIALVTRLTRANMLDVLHMDFMKTARSKGLRENTVIFKHALPNAISPVVTVLGLNAGRAFGGSVLVETIFGWPGIGRLTYQSLLMRDYPVLMGIFIVTSLMIVLFNLVTDIMYAVIDPRVRYK